MKISYLKEFCVLSDLLSFTHAAEQLYITQPALSRHIRLLEEEYGVSLIRRTTKSVELTDAGAKLKASIAPILEQYDAAVAAVKNKENPNAPLLRVGIPSVAVNNYLGRVPDLFRKACPGAALSFYPEDPETNLNRLFNGELDLIMISNIPFPHASLLDFHDYSVSPMIIVCSSGLPIADRESVTLGELKDYTFYVKNSSYYEVFWERISLQCKWAGFQPKMQLCASMDEAIVAARQGFGIVALTPHHRSLASAGLSSLTLDEPSCIIRSSLAWLKTNTNPLIPKFIEIFSQHGYFLQQS